MANISGTAGDDVLFDTLGDDLIVAGRGDDTVSVSGGVDSADGGDGNTYPDGDGDDTLVVNWENATESIGSNAYGYRGSFGSTSGAFQVNFAGFNHYHITTGSGDDAFLLDGDGGSDWANLGAGDDYVIVGNHSVSDTDYADGGVGIDTIRWSTDSTVGISWNLQTDSFSGPAGTHFQGFECFGGRGLFGLGAMLSTGSGNDIIVTHTLNLPDNIYLNAGDDQVTVVNGIDFVVGGDGSDTLIVDYRDAAEAVTMALGTPANGENGFVHAEAGREVTFHEIENITVQAGAWNDTLSGGSGTDTLSGMTGDDLLTGADDNDYLNGGADSDTLLGGNGVDVLDGGAGNDILNGGAGTDTASFASATAFVVVTLATQGVAQNTRQGMDTLIGIERLIGSDFNDQLTGGAGNDRLEGGLGNDFMVGNAGNDTFFGGDGDDRMDGGAGDDILNGNTGRDTAIYSSATSGVIVNLGITTAQNTVGAGNDTLNSIERLMGSNFGDTLTGNTSNNVIYGQDGNDTISGDAGSDVLYGGLGNDTLVGGAGQDNFIFDTALNGLTNVDQIQDFTHAYDKVRLDSSVFTQAGALGVLDANAFHAGIAAADSSDRIIYDSTTGNIYYDADGDGAGAQVLFAHVTAGTLVTNSDFIVI